MGGASFRPNPQLFKKDGELTTSRLEVDQRWQEHFEDVFAGQTVEVQSLREPDPEPPPKPCTTNMDVGPAATELPFAQLGRNKGVGRDGIPAELLLRAGGAPAAILYAGVNRRVLSNWAWPVQWRGGRMAPVYKRKGDSRDCDNSRGILLADHAGKALAGSVKRAIDGTYERMIPRAQCGAVPGRGTEEATHTIRTVLDWANLRQRCVFALFVDLVKALDKVMRQVAFGRGSSPPEDPVAALQLLGVAPGAANWLAKYIEEKGAGLRAVGC